MEEQLKASKQPKIKKAKTHKCFTFDAGSSKHGGGRPGRFSESLFEEAGCQARECLPDKLQRAGRSAGADGYKDIGVRYAMYCIGANLTIRDIELEEIAEIADLGEWIPRLIRNSEEAHDGIEYPPEPLGSSSSVSAIL